MVEIKLMGYSGLPQVINKSLSTHHVLNGTFRQPYSLMNPTIEISGVAEQASVYSGAVNYVEIEGKYYYITDWVMNNRNLFELSLHLDVLMTYKDLIDDLQIGLERSSNSPTPDVNDDMLPLSNDKQYTKIPFPREFSEDEGEGVYIVLTNQNGYRGVE